MSESYTREEQYLSAIAGGTVPDLTPITRKEMFLAAAAGQNVTPPEPITREEILLSKIQPGGGGDADPNAVARSILNGTITEYSDDKITTIQVAKFRACSKLTRVNLPNVTTLSDQAFFGSGITEANFPNVDGTSLGSSWFRECVFLEKVSIPKIITLASNSALFQGCISLKDVDLPSVTTLGSNVFVGCTALEELVFPSMNGTVGTSAFNGCTALRKIDFGGMANLNKGTIFSDCTNLKEVIIRGSAISPLSNVNCFNGTPFASGGTGGTVYVPSALIESYQTATNWSTLYAAGTCNFVAIEGSEYE